MWWVLAMTTVGVLGQPESPGGLIERRVVTPEAMTQWPVDRARSGAPCWGEATWGTGPLEGPDRRLFNWNVWPCRVVFEVEEAAGKSAVARGEAEWRRSGLSIRMRGLKLLTAAGEEVQDARLVHYGQEKVVVDFRPEAGAGLYYLYYGAYEEACFAPSPGWLAAADEVPEPPCAWALRIEARCAAEAFDEMEIIALPAEVEAFLGGLPDQPYLVFPEDRDRSIKLQFEIPACWAMAGPKSEVRLKADRHEYRVFQLGVWACREALPDVRVEFSELRSEGSRIEPERLQCLTLESRSKSRYIEKPSGTFPVPLGEVRALWCGIDIPEDVPAGTYVGEAKVAALSGAETVLPIRLEISETVVPERGDHDLYRLSRLRWVESDVGLSDAVYPPYAPLEVDEGRRMVASWGHVYSLGAWGLPEQISVAGAPVLAGPVELSGRVAGGDAEWAWKQEAFSTTETAPGYVEWNGTASAQGVRCRMEGRIEFDGCAIIGLSLMPEREAACRVEDLSLTIPWNRVRAPLAVGMGYRGRREGSCSWCQVERSASGPLPAVWMGGIEAGLGFMIWDMPAWEDPGRAGSATIVEEGGRVLLQLHFGGHVLTEQAPWRTRFALLPTPVKPVDERHWAFRYMHKGGGFTPAEDDTPQSFLKEDCRRLEEAVRAIGVKRLNLHDWWGPAFNYAWQWEGPDNLSRLTEEAHKRGLFVKVYNSGRELSTLAPEFWFLAYEGTGRHYDERIDPAPRLRFQDAWQQNHVPDGFPNNWPRCHEERGNEHSIPVSNHTRNGNFYLESMRYMTRFFGTDGAYWDGADGPTLGHREMAKRLWTIFRETNPDATIDVHHGHPLYDSPISMFMLCFPFIDSLWHGEGFDYDRLDPWAWLVEVAALPFNVPSEMLGDFEHVGRGMLFGIWPRYGWGGEPDWLPRLWGFFDEFEIREAEMLGWWLEPLGMGWNGVRVDRAKTYVTAFKHPTNGVLLAIGTWHPELYSWMEMTFDVSLQLDREILGLPEGPLEATDVLSGEPVDVTVPVPLPDMKAGRLIWLRAR